MDDQINRVMDKQESAKAVHAVTEEMFEAVFVSVCTACCSRFGGKPPIF